MKYPRSTTKLEFAVSNHLSVPLLVITKIFEENMKHGKYVITILCETSHDP